MYLFANITKSKTIVKKITQFFSLQNYFKYTKIIVSLL